MKEIKLTVQPELILFLSILIYKETELAIPFLAACVLHESGHVTMLHCIKHCIININMSINGAKITSAALSYRQTLLTTLAGPLANILGLLFWPLSPAFAYYNLILGIYNLLPLKFLDGGTILHTILAMHLPLNTADRISCIIGLFTTAGLCIIAIIAAFQFGILPLLISCMLLYRCINAYSLVS